MASITAVELGADICALARIDVRRGRGEVRLLAAEVLDPAAFPGIEAFTMAVRQTRRAMRFPRRCRVVVWGLPDGANRRDAAVKPLIEPLTSAGFRVERVVSPCNALAALARLKTSRGEGSTCWIAINRGGVAIVVVRPGKQLYAHSFAWDSSVGSSGSQARLLQRYSLVSFLSPEIRRAMAEARKFGTPVDAVVTCGNLPDLRSLTMPLIEELDVEVETLDSLEGLTVKPQVAEKLSEMAPAIRIACAAAIARGSRPWDPSKKRTSSQAIAGYLRAAALAAAVLGIGYLWYARPKPAPPPPVIAARSTPPPAAVPSASAAKPTPPPAVTVPQPSTSRIEARGSTSAKPGNDPRTSVTDPRTPAAKSTPPPATVLPPAAKSTPPPVTVTKKPEAPAPKTVAPPAIPWKPAVPPPPAKPPAKPANDPRTPVLDPRKPAATPAVGVAAKKPEPKPPAVSATAKKPESNQKTPASIPAKPAPLTATNAVPRTRVQPLLTMPMPNTPAPKAPVPPPTLASVPAPGVIATAPKANPPALSAPAPSVSRIEGRGSMPEKPGNDPRSSVPDPRASAAPRPNPPALNSPVRAADKPATAAAPGTAFPAVPAVQKGPMPPLLKDAVPRVTAILVSTDRRFATIDGGQIIGIGDLLGRRTVVAMDERSVLLQEPSGVQIRIGLGGRLLGIERAAR
jgi:hypothetical protein